MPSYFLLLVSLLIPAALLSADNHPGYFARPFVLTELAISVALCALAGSLLIFILCGIIVPWTRTRDRRDDDQSLTPQKVSFFENGILLEDRTGHRFYLWTDFLRIYRQGKFVLLVLASYVFEIVPIAALGGKQPAKSAVRRSMDFLKVAKSV